MRRISVTSHNPLADIAASIRRYVEGEELGSDIWAALPGPQTLARDCIADELFYGGQAGGGKTDLGLGLAFTQHRASVFFRRELTRLRGPEGAIERSKQIAQNFGRFNAALFTWRDLPGHRSLEFGGMERTDDWEKWKGRSHDLYVYDEIPEFLKKQYRNTIAWNRTVIPKQRCRVLATGNPPTSQEGMWVIQYWAPWLDKNHKNPAAPSEIRWYAVVDGEDVEVEDGKPFIINGEKIVPKSRSFIAASIEDNPYLMATDYKSRLQNLPEPLRSQLLYGDFSIEQTDDLMQIFPTAWVDAAMERWKERGGKEGKPKVYLSSLGMDPSRGGADETTCSPLFRTPKLWWFDEIQAQPGKNVPDGQHAAAFAIVVLGLHKKAPVHVDVSMIGSSPYDFLRESNVRAIPMNGANGSKLKDKSERLSFVNKRAEWHWKFREKLDPQSDIKICLPPDPKLREDLLAIKWFLTRGGIQIRPKDEIVEQLGRSPDRGDAVILASAEEEIPSVNIG